MSLVLYHSIESTCSQKVRFVLSEKKLTWEQINLNLRKGEQFQPDYLKLNPKAVVPTLLHNGQVIRESSVISEYLDDAVPEPPLRPVSAIDRAGMRLLLKAFDEEVHPSVGILSYAIVLRQQMKELYSKEELERHFAKITDPARRERQKGTHARGLSSPTAPSALEALKRVSRMMEDALAKGEWLAGEKFSLADACAIPYMVRIRNIGLAGVWEELPAVERWMERAIDRVQGYGLDAPWGSESFHEMVRGHVHAQQKSIEKFLGRS